LTLYTYRSSLRLGVNPNSPLLTLAETERIEADIKEHLVSFLIYKLVKKRSDTDFENTTSAPRGGVRVRVKFRVNLG